MRVIIKCDSMGLKETLNSTHQIEEKMLRPVVQNIKDLLTRGFIESVTRGQRDIDLDIDIDDIGYYRSRSRWQYYSTRYRYFLFLMKI